jgi:hypothetical protein
MRTTWNVEDDVVEKVKEYARARSIPAGEAASDLIRRGLQAGVPTKWENGLLIFAPGPEGAVTAEHVMDLKDEIEGEPW